MSYPVYVGPLSQKKMPPLVMRAKTAISHQRARCNNRRHPYYKWYGAKGIRVEYTTREFVAWFLNALPAYQGVGHPTVGRINHEKGYRFDNIRVESRQDNTREMCFRMNRDFQKKTIRARSSKTGKVIGKWNSIIETVEANGCSVTTVSRHVNGHVSSRKSRTGPALTVRFEAV